MRNEIKVFAGGMLIAVCFVTVMIFPHWYVFVTASLVVCYGIFILGMAARNLAMGRVKYLVGRERKLNLPEGEVYIYRGQHTIASMGLHLIFLEDMNGEWLYAQEILEPLRVAYEDESLADIKNGSIVFRHEPRVAMLVSVPPS